MPAGRPLKYQSVEDLDKAIDAYFVEAEEKKEHLTVTGLALALDIDRKTLLSYEEREEFLPSLKRAKTRVENYAEKRLFENSPTGAIFALKNFDWSDKTQQELSGPNGGPVSVKSILGSLDGTSSDLPND